MPIGCRNRPGGAPPSTAAAPPDRESRSRPAQSAGRALPPPTPTPLGRRSGAARVHQRTAGSQLLRTGPARQAKLPHSRFSGDGWCRQDAGSRLQQRHDLDGTFCQPGLLLCRREQFTNPADLLRGVSLGQTGSRHGRADDRMQVVGGQVVGRDGIEPPTLRFQPGAAHPGPSGIVRLSRICPDQQYSSQRGRPDRSGSVRPGADSSGRTMAEISLAEGACATARRHLRPVVAARTRRLSGR
jgi:hypothetical protein